MPLAYPSTSLWIISGYSTLEMEAVPAKRRGVSPVYGVACIRTTDPTKLKIFLLVQHLNYIGTVG
jgi:hypothetical protein